MALKKPTVIRPEIAGTCVKRVGRDVQRVTWKQSEDHLNYPSGAGVGLGYLNCILKDELPRGRQKT